MICKSSSFLKLDFVVASDHMHSVDGFLKKPNFPTSPLGRLRATTGQAALRRTHLNLFFLIYQHNFLLFTRPPILSKYKRQKKYY
jgi:hypothetical protein